MTHHMDFHYHDQYNAEIEALPILVTYNKDGVECDPKPYYTLKIGIGLTVFMSPARLRELAAVILDHEPLVAPPLAEHTPEEIADAVQWEGAVSI